MDYSKNTRIALESKTWKSVISEKNYLKPKKEKKLI